MRKALVVILILVAVVGVGGYFADNAVRGRAESQAAAALQARLALPEKPDVSLGGFPFSLALLTKSVPSAQASAGRVPLSLSGKDVALTGVRVETGELRLSDNQVHVASAHATGVLSYGDLATIAGVPLTYAGNGRLRLTYTVQLAGQEFSVGATAVPVLDVDAGVIRLTQPELEAGSLTVPISEDQLAQVVKPIPVELPAGARLTALTLSDGAVAVAAEVSDVTLPVS